MIALVRVDGVRTISDGNGGTVSVPDLQIPQGIEWSAYGVPGMDAFQFKIIAPWGDELWSVWHGPHVIGGQKLFFVDIPDDTDKRVLAALRDWLGTDNAAPLIRVLRLQSARGQDVRNYVKNQPWFNPVRNTLNQVVGIHPPLVISGRSAIDLDGDDLDDVGEIIL